MSGIAAPAGGGSDQMPDRIHFGLGAERLLEVRHGRRKDQQRVAHLLLARLIPVRHLEFARGRLLDLDRVLQRVDLLDVLGIDGVDQRPDRNGCVARADLLPGQRIAALAVDDFRHVVVFIDHLHRHEALAGVRQRDRDRPGVEIEDGRRIQRVAVEADHGLIVDPRRFATMVELSDRAAVFRIPRKYRSDSARMKLSMPTGMVLAGGDCAETKPAQATEPSNAQRISPGFIADTPVRIDPVSNQNCSGVFTSPAPAVAASRLPSSRPCSDHRRGRRDCICRPAQAASCFPCPCRAKRC